MADKNTPDRVKQLYSSFLSSHSRTIPTGSKSDRSPTKDGDANVDVKAVPDSRNKASFYDRVESYSALMWFAKPLYLSPLVCARYGWINTDTDMLQCVHCRNFLSGQLPKAVDTHVYKDSCEKLKNGLRESHEKICKWSTNPCPESFMSVPYHDHEELLTNYCSRVSSLLCTGQKLPIVTYSSFIDKGMTEDKLEIYLDQIIAHIKDLIQEVVSTQIALLALCGWSYSECKMDILQCNYCRRKVGLWNYCHVTDVDCHGDDITEDTQDESTDDQPAKKRPKLEKQNFDPVAEHRYWCPWIQSGSTDVIKKQRNEHETSLNTSPLKSPPSNSELLKSPPALDNTDTQSQPAWLIVAKILSQSESGGNSSFTQQMRKSPQIEGLRHLRRVLRDCTSPTTPRKNLAAINTSVQDVATKET